MPKLTITIPSSLEAVLKDAVVGRASSLDGVVTAALTQYFQSNRHRACQISTSAALVQGVYGGAVSSRTLLANGDLGLGAFEHLDGEMVVLDDNIYQVLGDGHVQRRQGDFRVPFAVVSRFQPEETFNINAVDSLNDLERACDPHRESDNLVYALRVDGVFEGMLAYAWQHEGPQQAAPVDGLLARTNALMNLSCTLAATESAWMPAALRNSRASSIL